MTLLLALLFSQPPATDHAKANPLYRDLRETGLAVGGDVRVKLPAPTLPDGLDAAKQKAVIGELIRDDHPWDEFTRDSVVAPHLLRLRDEKGGDPKTPARGLDLWFVVHGDFDRLADDAFAQRLLNAGKEREDSRALTADELTKRKLAVPPAGRHERYGQIKFDLLERVRIAATGRVVWSKTPESVVAAVEIDPRFVGDAEFPSEWRPLTKDGDGLTAGPPQPYTGAGLYLKATKLADPPGAVFVEQHVVFAEPAGWFDGVNLLRSKLPPVVQNNVRTLRREWAKK